MTASQEIQRNYEEQMKFKEHYIENASGTVYNALTHLDAMIKAIVIYLDAHSI